MKKLILKILLMMGASMILVLLISRLGVFILQKKSILSPELSYHVSLISGAFGLLFFGLLLYLLIGKRLKSISMAVNEVTNGKMDTKVPIKGKDELSKLSDDFNKMIEGLKSNEYLNREFVKNVSHEFKTPLSIILGYSDLLNSDNITNEQRKEYTDFIQKEAIRLVNLSEKLLLISRIDSNYNIICSDYFSIDEQIRDIILAMQVTWLHKKINVEVEMDKINHLSNKDLCHIIWENLISNAIKYTPNEGKIVIKLNKKNRSILFNISNTGNEIKGKEDLIFQPFYTNDIYGKEKGTGLGLPLVKKVVEKLGGNIQVKCEKNTSFIVELPIKEI